MKKILAISAILFLAVTVIIFTLPYYVNENGIDAAAYARITIPKIVDPWNTQEIFAQSSEELRKHLRPGELSGLFEIYSSLGKLKNVSETSCSAKISFRTDERIVVTGKCLSQAEFTNGKASIAVDIRRTDNAWRIDGFRVSSPFLAARMLTGR